MRRITILLFLILFATAAQAAELRELYTGAASRAMSNAVTADVEGMDAIYLNPAGMAGNKGMSFHYLPLVIETSTDTIGTASSSVQAFHNLNASSLNTLIGHDIYARTELSPALLLPNFGVSYLVDEQFALLSRNQSLPQFDLGYQSTNGIQLAYGVSVLSAGRKNREAKDDLRIGIGYKIMYRRGGYHLLSITDLMKANAATIKTLEGTTQEASAADFGMQYIRKVNSRLKLFWGLSYTEIGDLKFGSGTDTQSGNLSTGVALKYKTGPILTTTIAYDLRHLNENVEFQKRNHLGISFALPLVTIYGGLNQTMPTYGASVDIWLLKVTALAYGEEQEAVVGLDEQRRYMLELDLKFGI